MRFIENRLSLLKCLVGSHNYNLNTATSDKDYKYFIAPTFDELYNGKQFSSSSTGTDIDYTIHDIRKIPSLLFKANINFIEVLFSRDVEYEYNTNIQWMFDNKQELATMNLPYLYSACVGMHYEKMKKLFKGTSGTKHLVDKFGYDTKEAMCAYRVLDFITRMSMYDFDFGKAVSYGDEGDNRQTLLSIKNGDFALETFYKLVEDRLSWVHELEEQFKVMEVNVKLKEELDEHIKSIVKLYIQD